MFIKQYGEYILQGRKTAALNAVIWTAVPLMGWLGLVIMSLVTLRNGAREGLIVLLWMAVPHIVFAFMGYEATLIYGVIFSSVIAWICACILRQTRSWAMVIQLSLFIVLVAILLLHVLLPDIATQWLKYMQLVYSEVGKDFAVNMTPEKLDSLMQFQAKLATGYQACAILAITIVNLMIARWWQAILFNPGGLSKELRDIRFGYSPLIVLLLLITAIFLGMDLPWDMLPPVLLVFFIAGLSLIHAFAKMTQSVWVILVVYYISLLIFFPYVGLLTILLAVFDIFVNFRRLTLNEV